MTRNRERDEHPNLIVEPILKAGEVTEGLWHDLDDHVGRALREHRIADTISNALVRTILSLAVVLGLIGVAAIGYSLANHTTTSSASTSVSSPPKSQPPAKLATTPAATISLTLETGKMDGRPGWPKYIPADVTVAAHETVEIKITSYDNGTAPLLPAMISYDKVAGGIETVNGHRVTAVANNAIAHTFTVAALGLNAVVPAVTGNAKTVTVTFTFEVSKAGTYTWNCFAPCGTGANGMAGPMVTPGWMTGSFTVA